jgi:hypothetical protein
MAPPGDILAANFADSNSMAAKPNTAKRQI